MYRADGWLPKKKDRIVKAELDIKNQVLADKRRTLLKFLKDKRTNGQLEEASLIHTIKEHEIMSSHEMDALSPIYPRYQDGQPLILQLDGEKFSNEIIFENESEVNYDTRKTVLHKTPKVHGPNKSITNFKQ